MSWWTAHADEMRVLVAEGGGIRFVCIADLLPHELAMRIDALTEQARPSSS